MLHRKGEFIQRTEAQQIAARLMKRGRYRSKAARQTAKARGTRLGNPRLPATANAVRSAEAKAFAMKLKSTLEAFTAAGLTQEQMCQRLDSINTPTPKGGKWSPVQLRRVLRRLEGAA